VNVLRSDTVSAPFSAKIKTPGHAIVLNGGAVATKRAAAFLQLLGIEAVETTLEELIGRAKSENRCRGVQPICLLLSGEDVALLAQIAARRGVSLDQVAAPFAAVILHSLGTDRQTLGAVEELSGTKLSIAEFSSSSRNYSIRGSQLECGSLAGLSFGPIDKATDRGLIVLSSDGTTEKIIEIDDTGLLTRIRRPWQDILISTVTEVADLGQTTSQKIDFRTSFSRVVPLLLAARIVLRESCWLPRGYWANIVIDDPPLWARYGHLNLRLLAELTDRLGSACTIGMIPWNYRRSRRKIAELFANRAPELGICYHGCDHTRAEFGVSDYARLTRLITTARQRMASHERMTNVPCQPVMVFPQGVFSVEAMRCLHATGYLAAVNTEIQDFQRQVPVTWAEFMQPALLCYDNFPLFSRRNPCEGIVNFAVDAFLGKPCLAVVHHQFFKRGYASFEELVDNISNLHPQLRWASLENIAMESSLSRLNSKGESIVKIFSDRAIINRDNSSSAMTVVKPVDQYDVIEGVDVDGEPSDYTGTTAYVRIPLQWRDEKSARISVRLASAPIAASSRELMTQRLRVAVRRYACEFRDNYLEQSEILRRSTQALRRIVRRPPCNAASAAKEMDNGKTEN
jgi:hypothetical protein